MSHRHGQLWPEGFQIKVKVIQVHVQQAALHQFNTKYSYIESMSSMSGTNIQTMSLTLTNRHKL